MARRAVVHSKLLKWKTLIAGAFSKRWGTLLLCLAFTLIMVHGWVLPLGAIWYANGSVMDDPAQTVWGLWHFNEAVSEGQNPYFTNSLFYPVGAPILHPTSSEGSFPISFLVRIIMGGRSTYPFYAYRITILGWFVLLLYFSYLLLRELGITRLAAAIAAAGYAFSRFFIDHTPHLNVLAGFFIPLGALALLRLYKRPSTLRLFAVAITLGVCLYFTEFLFHILFGIVCLIGLMLIFSDLRTDLFNKLRLLGWKQIMLAFGLFLLIVAPAVVKQLSAQVLSPAAIESSNFSANLAGLLLPNPQRTPLYGALFAKFTSQPMVGVDGHEVFIGLPLLIFGVAGLMVTKQRGVRIAAVLAIVFFVLSLGPTLKILSLETGLRLPYALLMKIPPFNLARGPARFVAVGLFFLMLVAASGMSWMQTMLECRGGAALSVIAMVVIFLWTVAEGYAPAPPQAIFVPPKELSGLVAGPVLNLPLSRYDGYALLLQMYHRRPVATGYTSRYTAGQLAQVDQLTRLIDKAGPRLCDELARTGFRNIIVAPVSVLQAPFDFSGCSLKVVDLRQPITDLPTVTTGVPVDLSKVAANQYLFYGWSNPEANSRWTDHGSATLAFKLEEPSASRLRIKLAPFLVTGKLNVQRLTVKLNGISLQMFTLTDPSLTEYTVALPPAALRKENVLSLELPDAESPVRLGLSEDSRLLGVNVAWIELD